MDLGALTVFICISACVQQHPVSLALNQFVVFIYERLGDVNCIPLNLPLNPLMFYLYVKGLHMLYQDEAPGTFKNW